mmetsp:Transcript_158706/g.485846  ORF Transcript_158706/g.485846 Transcript_158706/m.485846 type:complete len:339 (-) Transcript_158706:20-1036(-)
MVPHAGGGPARSASAAELGGTVAREVILSEAPFRMFEEVALKSKVRVLDDADAVLQASRDAGIGAEHDELRLACLGKVVQVIRKDPGDGTVKCSAPLIGKVWFPVSALCPTSADKAGSDRARHARAAREVDGPEGDLPSLAAPCSTAAAWSAPAPTLAPAAPAFRCAPAPAAAPTAAAAFTATVAAPWTAAPQPAPAAPQASTLPATSVDAAVAALAAALGAPSAAVLAGPCAGLPQVAGLLGAAQPQQRLALPPPPVLLPPPGGAAGAPPEVRAFLPEWDPRTLACTTFSQYSGIHAGPGAAPSCVWQQGVPPPKGDTWQRMEALWAHHRSIWTSLN